MWSTVSSKDNQVWLSVALFNPPPKKERKKNVVFVIYVKYFKRYNSIPSPFVSCSVVVSVLYVALNLV